MGLNVIRSIEQMIVNMTIAAPIARGLMSILGGFVPGAGTSTSVGVPTGLGAIYANGGVQSGPGISAFSNQIVDRPTIFPFAKGIGLMGEAGAEAIMPLTRIGGKLGVRADGGGNNINFGDVNITLPQDPNGNDPTGDVRAGSIMKHFEKTIRTIVRDENIRGYRQGGVHNRF
jgi:lambda family phage tail tape measure protein